MKIKKKYIIILSVIIGVVMAYYWITPVNELINNLISMLSEFTPEGMASYIRSFGPWAIAISVGLMMFQSIAAPLPAFVITAANAMIWGWWQGVIISWFSAMLGAVMCFYIARYVGREGIERFLPKVAMSKVDGYFERYGKYTILICRLIPFVSFDFVSYGAGLTSMKIGGFLLGTGIGQLPAAIVYSYIAGNL